MAIPMVPVFAPVPGISIAHAPSRRVKPGAEPTIEAVWALLRERQIPRSIETLTAELATSGWLWRIEGGRGSRFTAKIVVPWLDLWCWSWFQADDLLDALGGALALALASPPPPVPDWPNWPVDPEWARIA